MHFKEFSSHQDATVPVDQTCKPSPEEKKLEEKVPVWQTYGLITEEGKLIGICATGELRGQIYRREDKEIENVYRKAIKTFAGDNTPALQEFMTEIRGDDKYFQIARQEILKTVKDLQAMIDC